MSRLSIRECRIDLYSDDIKANIVGLDSTGNLLLEVCDGNRAFYRINAVKDHVMIFDVLDNKVIDAQYTKYYNMGCNIPTFTICEAVTDLLRNTHHLKKELFFTVVHGSDEELYINEFRNRFKNRER